MRDLIGNKIHMSSIPNGHILITGKSGMGKTYALNRIIEENISADRKVLVVDFSGSFSKKELEKAEFALVKETKFIQVGKDILYLPILDLVDTNRKSVLLADILSDMVRLNGYVQKKILNKVCKKLSATDSFNFIDVENAMLEIYESYKENDNKAMLQTVEKMMDKFMPLFSDYNIVFSKKNIGSDCLNKRLVIIQMELLPDEVCEMLSNLLIACQWQEIKRRQKRYDTVVLDEMQYLNIKENTSFASLLREGRKFDNAVVLATQYFNDELSNLLGQVGHRLIFRPVEKEIKKIVKYDFLGEEKWTPLLKQLKVGEAIYMGSFTYNHNRKICNQIVKVMF